MIINDFEKLVKEFPKLYKKTSTGAIQEWQVSVMTIHNDPIIVNYYGQVGGKIQESIEHVLEGKNIGRANETTAIQQAEAQAKSRWEKQLKKGYVQNIEDAQAGNTDALIEGGVFPILAHKFSEQGHKITYPALAQPKLDGHRCIAQHEQDDLTIFYSLWSRTRKSIKGIPHISQALRDVFRRFTDTEQLQFVDGELYNHDYKNNFEELTSFIRQDEPKEGHEIVEYHVYDIPDENLTNWERYAILENLRPEFEGTPIKIVETIIVHNEEELYEYLEDCLARGYEGCMVRNVVGRYEYKRSYNLQKLKKFDDSEFKIIGVKVGTKGSMAGKAVFICENGETTFDCKLKGNMDELTKYANDPSLVVGKILTVKYQGMTKYGQPRFPVGMRFREDV